MHRRVIMFRSRVRAVKNNKTNDFFQFRKAMPFPECGHVVFADEIIDFRVSFASSDFFNSINRDAITGGPFMKNLITQTDTTLFTLKTLTIHLVDHGEKLTI